MRFFSRRKLFGLLACSPVAIPLARSASATSHLIYDPTGALMCKDCYSHQMWEADEHPLRFYFREWHGYLHGKDCRHSARNGTRVYQDELA